MPESSINIDPTGGIITMIDSAFTFMTAAMEAHTTRTALSGQEKGRQEIIDYDRQRRIEDQQAAGERYERWLQDKREDDEKSVEANPQRDVGREALKHYPTELGSPRWQQNVRWAAWTRR